MISNRFKNNGKCVTPITQNQRSGIDTFLEKMRVGIYELEHAKCAICGFSNYKILSEKDRYGIPYTTVICVKCALIFATPRLSKASHEAFYKNDYRRIYNGKELADRSIYNEQLVRGDKLLEFCTNYVKVHPNSRILEVGCGAGGILSSFSKASSSTFGIDYGLGYLSYAKSNSRSNVFAASIQALKPNNKFDLIIYSHVFEHIYNTSEELKYLSKLLAPSGHLLIEVPGVFNLLNSYKMDYCLYLQSAHLYNFSLNTLCKLMHANGYSFVAGTEEIKAIFQYVGKSDARSKCGRVNNYVLTVFFLRSLEVLRFLNLVRFSTIKDALRNLAKKRFGYDS